MNLDTFEAQYRNGFTALQGDIQETIGQIINKKSQIELVPGVHGDLQPNLLAETFPKVAIAFQSGGDAGPVINILTLQQELVLQFFAWMVGDEPAAEITEDHTEALKEASQQLIGKIKMAVADDQGIFQIEDLKVFTVEDSSAIQSYSQESDGILSSYLLKAEGKSFDINHYIWPTITEDSAVADAMDSLNENEFAGAPAVDVAPATFGAIPDLPSNDGQPRNVDMLLDVELDVTVELGNKQMLISDVLKLGKGSIVELEKSAGEPLDIFVNGRKLAEGEVVVVDDHFGIRITQLANPKERVKSLG